MTSDFTPVQSTNNRSNYGIRNHGIGNHGNYVIIMLLVTMVTMAW